MLVYFNLEIIFELIGRFEQVTFLLFSRCQCTVETSKALECNSATEKCNDGDDNVNTEQLQVIIKFESKADKMVFWISKLIYLFVQTKITVQYFPTNLRFADFTSQPPFCG